MPGIPGQRGYGFVNYIDHMAAEFAMMALNGVVQPDGCKLVVKRKNSGRDPEAGGPGTWAPPKLEDETPKDLNPIMLERIKKKLAEGNKESSFDISQWYITEFLGHITEEAEMKTSCDQLLAVCAHLGVQG